MKVASYCSIVGKYTSPRDGMGLQSQVVIIWKFLFVIRFNYKFHVSWWIINNKFNSQDGHLVGDFSPTPLKNMRPSKMGENLPPLIQGEHSQKYLNIKNIWGTPPPRVLMATRNPAVENQLRERSLVTLPLKNRGLSTSQVVSPGKFGISEASVVCLLAFCSISLTKCLGESFKRNWMNIATKSHS